MLSRIQILYQNYNRTVTFNNTVINFACGVFYRNRVELDSFSSSKFLLFVMISTVAFGILTDIYFRYCFRLRRMCCYMRFPKYRNVSIAYACHASGTEIFAKAHARSSRDALFRKEKQDTEHRYRTWEFLEA